MNELFYPGYQTRSTPTTTNIQTIKPPQTISRDDARELRDVEVRVLRDVEEGIPISGAVSIREVDTGRMTVGLPPELLVIGCNSV